VLRFQPEAVDAALAARTGGGEEVVWGGTLPEEIFTKYGGVALSSTSSGVCEFGGFFTDLVCVDRDANLRRFFEGARVRFWLDNKEVVQILTTFRLGGIHSLKKLRLALATFEILDRWNCLGEFLYVPTGENPADAPTRMNPVGRERGLRLAPVAFRRIVERFGRIELDAMSDQACRQLDTGGGFIPYISRHVDADSIGEDVFQFDLGAYGFVYVNPPRVMVRVVVQHLRQTGARGVLVCAACAEPLPPWLRVAGMKWSERMALGSTCSQLRIPQGWEVFRGGGELVAVEFDFRGGGGVVAEGGGGGGGVGGGGGGVSGAKRQRVE
jgi:hypothetical protein